MIRSSKIWQYVGRRKNQLAYALLMQVVVFIFFYLLAKGFILPSEKGGQLREILSASIPYVSLGILLRIVFNTWDIPLVLPMIIITPLFITGPSLYTVSVILFSVAFGYILARYAEEKTKMIDRVQMIWMAIVGAFLQITINSTVWYMVYGEGNLGKVFFSSFFLIVTAPGLLTVMLFIADEVFAISTVLKILDVSNEASPLLRTLRNAAPGTYYHSVNTAFIAEEGALAIGADRLLCRAGGLYHDIGKMWKPEYYGENQFEDDNVHEQITKDVSRMIIISHIDEGIKLASKHGLGKNIEEIIRRHHGNAPLYYYDHRIRRESDRYPGPVPSTREEGIVMLSDSVEATARSLNDMSVGELGKVVQFVIERARKDGQLAGVVFSDRDLHLLEGAFVRSLKVIYHNRIFYPSQDGLLVGGADDAGLFEKPSEDKESKDEFAERDGKRGPGGIEYH